MRFAYAGTAPFAELVLTGLAEAGRTPVVLVTNPDRPRGRHGTPQPPRIKLLAEELGVPVLQPERLSAPEALEALLAFEPEVFVVCAYGQIVAQSVLDAVETIVVHPSLVPHWRGAAPVERALMAGETRARCVHAADDRRGGRRARRRRAHRERAARSGRRPKRMDCSPRRPSRASANDAGRHRRRRRRRGAPRTARSRTPRRSGRPTRRSTGAGPPSRSPTRCEPSRRTSAR